MQLMAAAAAAMILSLASGGAAGAQSPEPVGVRTTVERDGERWTAEYVLDRDAPVWAFHRSALLMNEREPWRLRQWTVETPGVVLDRQGRLDVLRTVDGSPVPRRVRLSMRPASVNLEADYDPALVFTDGSVAMFAGHFTVFPLDSTEAARNLPIDLNEARLEQTPIRMVWRDRAGPVLYEGERAAQAETGEDGAYVLFGEAAILDTPQLATVMDPALPAWIGEEIGTLGPEVAGYYKARLGAGQTEKPTIYMNWKGPRPSWISMGGSVLPGMIVMGFEGDALLQASPRVREGARWFIGHESAHFWLGQTVRYEYARDAWITEGGADLMAIRAMAAIDPAYNAANRIQEAVDECVGLADEPVADANQRGEHRAYYACGAVFALAAEGLQRRASGGDWLDFLRPLIDANRTDGVLTRDEWLDALDALATGPELRTDIERLLDQGDADPAAAVAGVLSRAGVPASVADGRVVLGQ